MNKYFFLILITLLWACSGHEHSAIGLPVSEDGITESPYLTLDTAGNPVLSWIKEVKNGEAVIYFSVSDDHGHNFSNQKMLEVTAGVQPHGENLPKIMYKPNGDMIVAWGTANPNPKNKYSAVIYYSQSFDKGETWTEARPLVSDTTSYDQRYFDFTALPNGEAGIVWLDNRERVSNHGMTVFFAQTDGRNGFQNEKIVGRTSCECCRTKIMVDSENRVHLAYRAILGSNIRDMVHQVSEDGGKTFSLPQRISPDNWALDACPHTGPTMTENESGIHFVWFTGGNDAPGIYHTSYKGNNNNFEKAGLLSSHGKHPQMNTLSDGGIATVWEESVEGNDGFYSKIILLHTEKNGEQHRSEITGDDMNASFPVIIPTENRTVTIAWTASKKSNEKSEGHHNHIRGGQVFYKTIHL